MTLSDLVQVLTIISVIGSAVWGVATMRAAISGLTHSVDGLTKRIDKIDEDHVEIRERVARLEG